jgi:hypothetical protein
MSEQVAWLAGLLEGEGSFVLRRNGTSLSIQLGMVDRDVVYRAREVMGSGSINERILPSGKICYNLKVNHQDVAREWMVRLLPYMGERRAERIRSILAERAKHPEPKRNWTHCSHGHRLDGPNLRLVTEGKYEKRRCLECGRLRQRKYRAKAA